MGVCTAPYRTAGLGGGLGPQSPWSHQLPVSGQGLRRAYVWLTLPLRVWLQEGTERRRRPGAQLWGLAGKQDLSTPFSWKPPCASCASWSAIAGGVATASSPSPRETRAVAY